MKKLYTIFALLMLAQFASAQFVHTNYSAVDANDISGNYDSYNFNWMGRDSQTVTLDVNFGGVTNDLSGLTMGWKMSLNARTGQVDYVIISNSQITVSSGTVSFSVTNTSIPPNNTYESELFGYTGTGTNLTRTLAQGYVDVKNSLYEDDNLFTFPSVTGLLEYVRKDGDFDQFTGLDGTNGQLWVADGSGSGAWALPSPAAGSVTNVGSGSNVLVTGTSQFPIINTDGSLQTGINLNSASNAANTAAWAAFTNQSHIFSEDQTMLGSLAVSTNVTATKFSTPSINVSTNITTVQALTQTEIGLENIGVYAKTQPSGAGPFRFYAWSGTDGGLAWYESTAPGVASDKYARWANPSYAGRYENGDGARQVTFEDGTYALNVNSGDSYFGGDVTGASNLTVNGDSNLPDLTVTNSLTLGDDLITNKISVSAVKLDSTWVPDTSNAYDIGSVELPVRGLYVTTITNQDLAVNGDATIESNLVVNGLITLPMGTLIRWETDSTNYIEFGGLSSTQQLMRFVVDGVTSNTYFNMISD